MPALAAACLTMAWVFCRGRIDGGLVQELEPLAVLGAHPVGAALPAGRVQDLVGLVDVELPAGVPGVEARGARSGSSPWSAPAARRSAPAPPRGPRGGSRAWRTAGSDEGGVGGLDAGALPVHLPVHGSVKLHWMCSMIPGGPDLDAPLPPCSKRREDVVLDLDVPRVVVLRRSGAPRAPRRRRRRRPSSRRCRRRAGWGRGRRG